MSDIAQILCAFATGVIVTLLVAVIVVQRGIDWRG